MDSLTQTEKSAGRGIVNIQADKIFLYRFLDNDTEMLTVSSVSSVLSDSGSEPSETEDSPGSELLFSFPSSDVSVLSSMLPSFSDDS